MADSPQGVLPGFEAEPVVSDRLFFALLPDAAARTQLVALARQLRQAHGCKGRVIAAERLHLTLAFLGNHVGMPQRLVADAMAAASTVQADALRVMLCTAQSFYRKRKAPLVLVGHEGSAETVALQNLHRQLADALAAGGVPRAAALPASSAQPLPRPPPHLSPSLPPHLPPPFLPHVTLLYDDLLLAPLAVEPVRWTATELVLVHSLIGKSRHTVLGHWPLRQPAATLPS